jgi:hypothetical protein
MKRDTWSEYTHSDSKREKANPLGWPFLLLVELIGIETGALSAERRRVLIVTQPYAAFALPGGLASASLPYPHSRVHLLNDLWKAPCLSYDGVVQQVALWGAFL